MWRFGTIRSIDFMQGPWTTQLTSNHLSDGATFIEFGTTYDNWRDKSDLVD